ncbi:MAG: NYN domain-containing protein [Sedimentisphaerales bacterium]
MSKAKSSTQSSAAKSDFPHGKINVLLVDGYNLLRAVQNLSEQTASVTDTQVCHIISRYLTITKNRGAIIFDGIGPRDKSCFNNLANLEVVFSGRNKEADDVIEKLVLINSAPRSLTVVSSDRRIKAAAGRRKATAVNSIDFWLEMLKIIDKKAKKKTEPPAKYLGISESETEYWLRLFGLLK